MPAVGTDEEPGAGDGQAPQRRRPPVWRVRRRDTFEALRRGRRSRVGPITVSWIPEDQSEPPKVAYAVGRRVGGAVVRNRVRRRLRMLIREQAKSLRPGAYLVGVGPGTDQLDFPQLRAALSSALRHLDER
jgi:ribonuclease P protein component